LLFGISCEVDNAFFRITLDTIKLCSSGKLEELLSEGLFSFYWVILDAGFSDKTTSITDLSEGLISIFFSRSEFSFKFSDKIIEFWPKWDVDLFSLLSSKSESSNLSLFLIFC